MIIAFASLDDSSQASLFKPFIEMNYEKQKHLHHQITNHIQNQCNTLNSSSFESDNLCVATIRKGTTTYSLLTNNDTPTESFLILDHIKPLLNSNMYDTLFLINEVFTFCSKEMECKEMVNYDLIPLNVLSNILNGETEEERIYINMMKGKELESYQRMKDIKKNKPDNIEVQLEKVRNLELEMRNEQLKQLEKLKNDVKEVKVIKKPVRKQRMSVDGDFVVSIREKLSVKVDKDGNVKECFVNGDISVIVKNEDLRKEEIVFRKKDNVNTKYSPNIDKTKAEKNILWSERGFPLNKNVALMKWKKDCEIPLNFSFWVNEINEEKNMVQFEIENFEDLKDLTFNINKKKGIVIENKDVKVNSGYVWKVGEDPSIEILCDDYEDIFPIGVDFWTDKFRPSVEIKSDPKYKIVKIFEVEKFEIVY